MSGLLYCFIIWLKVSICEGMCVCPYVRYSNLTLDLKPTTNASVCPPGTALIYPPSLIMRGLNAPRVLPSSSPSMSVSSVSGSIPDIRNCQSYSGYHGYCTYSTNVSILTCSPKGLTRLTLARLALGVIVEEAFDSAAELRLLETNLFFFFFFLCSDILFCSANESP